MRWFSLVYSKALNSHLFRSIQRTPPISLRAVLAGWILAWSWAAPLSSALSSQGEADEITLVDALERLRTEGIETLYSSRWVNGGRTVSGLPGPGTDAERLAELLHPLGLQATRDDDGLWLIEPLADGSITGRVVRDPAGDPLSGAVVMLQSSGTWVTTDSQGRFSFPALPTGRYVLEVSRPGFQTLRRPADLEMGQQTSLQLGLRLDAIVQDEVVVSAPPVDPPLGSTVVAGDELGHGSRTEQDLMSTLARSLGTVSENGVVFSVRGADPGRMSLVLDGVEIIEPYHFRDMGGVAGAVAPGAIGEARLHRGAPPLEYGGQAGGVLELLSRAPDSSWGIHLGLGNDARQAGFRSSDRQGVGHLMANARRGEPAISPLLGELFSQPSYGDAMIKLSVSPNERHDLQLQWLDSQDDLSFDFISADNRGFERFNVLQRSEYGLLRYQGHWRRSFAHVTVFDSASKRYRQTAASDSKRILKQLIPVQYRNLFLFPFEVSYLRRTERQGMRGGWTFESSPQFQLRVGGESRREVTSYDYEETTPLRVHDSRGDKRLFRYLSTFEDSRRSVFGAGTWRPLDRLTLGLGWRYDRSDISGHKGSPRVSSAWQVGSGVLRLDWSRVNDFADTFDLEPADNQRQLPPVESTEILSFGYHKSRPWGRWGIELYNLRIRDPRLRFESILKPVSRFPEQERDRIVLQPERSRSQGLELVFSRHLGSWKSDSFYSLARVEDRLDGIWVPSRTDRRHSWKINAQGPVSKNWHLWAAWWGHSGGPTTPFDAELGLDRLADGLGEYQSARLPPTHQLDFRLRRVVEWRGLRLVPEIGVDNAYDRRAVRGFSLIALNNETPELPPELGLGRQWRWGIEISWR